MSAAKRRVKRKIAMLVRMDMTHYLCHLSYRPSMGRRSNWYAKHVRSPGERAATGKRILANMEVLCTKLFRQGHFAKVVDSIYAARAVTGRRPPKVP